jgi:tetratricopeptide (TPR) repeat protein
VPLSGALDIVDKNVQSTRDIIGGLTERSRLGYLAVLERLYQPDHGGLDDEFYDGTRLNILYAVALTEAHRGCESALKRIEEFEAQPLFQVSGWRVRMIYYLGQGDTLKALQCKEKLELLQIQNSPLQFFEGSHVYTEMILYASSDDLAGVQQTIDTIQKMAKRFRGWIPILHYARAQYQRIRGDFPSAASELEEGLKMATPGHHILWPYLAACTITTLVELGRVAEAVERGRQWVEAGEEVTFDITFNFVTRALAWAEAKSGEYESAIARLELVIREFEAAGITGINLGRMYETRARIAVLMGDHASFKHFAECCYGQYKVGHNPALTAKYDKLIQEAKHAKVGVTDDLARAAWITDILSRTSSGEGSTNDGKSPDGRLQRLLEMLVNDSNSAGGFLYLMRDKGPLLSAQSGPLTPSVGLGSLARDYVLAEIGGDERLTTASEEEKDAADDNAWKGDQGEAYRPVLLGHYTLEGYAITGLALLLKDASKPFVFPADAVAAISKSLLDTGEVCKVCTKG